MTTFPLGPLAAGDRPSAGLVAAVRRHPELGQLRYVDRGRFNRRLLAGLVAGFVIGCPFVVWLVRPSPVGALVIAIAAAALETALYGLGHTSLAACQHGIILVHWPLPRWNHTAVPYAVIEPASLRAFNRLDRLTAMVGRQALVFQDSHPTGRGIVFVGPIPAAGGHIQLGPGPRRLWWYACHRDPAETAWTLLNLMAQAGDHRLAGWTGRPISAAELTGQPVDAAAGTWYTDVRELAGAEDEKKKFNFGGDGTDVDGIAAFFQILKHYLDGLP